MKKWIYCIAILLIAQESNAQFGRYVIQFRNKGTSPYAINTPLQYLSQRAIDRRVRYNIPIDSTDLPITPRYIDSVRLAGAVTILNVSKWLNSVTIFTTDQNALTKINSFSFVQSSKAIAARLNNTIEIPENPNKFLERTISTNDNSTVTNTQNTTADFFNYGLSYNQVHIHNGEFLHNIGLRGQSMVIGMLDAGYFNYPNLKSFDSVRLNGQILGTWDFVAREASVTEDNAHGMNCFSIIAANIPGQFVGTAPKANFYLFRTEDVSSEYPIEEHNWVVGAERVDSAGGDLISSSLGYTTFDNNLGSHTYADLNGNIAMATIGADLAAKKGILVLNSAGNDGNSAWHYISSPADGDSVLAVGAVNTSGTIGSFSSYGPSSDGQVKPDVASVGVSTVQQGTSTITTQNGTSFACPNMAGLTTCLWQGFQEFNNMKIIDALRRAGSIYTTPNDRIGYGIPDVKKALLFLVKDFSTASASVGTCKTTINWTSKDVSAMKYEIERKAPGETSFTKIGEKQGAGSIFSNKTHQFADTLINVQAGNISYRIRQIIDTAAATFMADYIDTVNVNLAASCVTTAIDPVTSTSQNIILLPNPARDQFSLKITTTSAIPVLYIRMMNGVGQHVSTWQKSKQSGTSVFEFPIHSLPKGKYYVNVYSGQQLLGNKELIKL